MAKRYAVLTSIGTNMGPARRAWRKPGRAWHRLPRLSAQVGDLEVPPAHSSHGVTVKVLMGPMLYC